jgi:hypothetical protein
MIAVDKAAVTKTLESDSKNPDPDSGSPIQTAEPRSRQRKPDSDSR